MRRALSIAVASLAASASLVIACSESPGVVLPNDPNDPNDGSAIVPPESGALPEDAGAPIDSSSVDASQDVPCTSDGICATTLPPDQILRGVVAAEAGVAWAVSEQGKILRWDGSAWSIVHDGVDPLYAIWASGPTNLWAAGANGFLHGQGATSASVVWTRVPSGSTLPIFSIWGTAANDIWAVGGQDSEWPAAGIAIHFDGATWTIDATASREKKFVQVWGSSSDVWIGGGFWADGAVLLRRSAGSWSDVSIPLKADGSPIIDVTAGGIFGDRHIIAGHFDWGRSVGWSSAGGNIDWVREPSLAFSTDYHALWGAGEDDIWMVGDYGRVRRWNGTSWTLPRITSASLPLVDTFWGVAGSGPDDVWLVGSHMALHKGPSEKKAR